MDQTSLGRHRALGSSWFALLVVLVLTFVPCRAWLYGPAAHPSAVAATTTVGVTQHVYDGAVEHASTSQGAIQELALKSGALSGQPTRQVEQARLPSPPVSAAEDTAGGARSLFHYTTEEGQKGILDSGQLNPSLKSINPADARYGNGQYLTDLAPGARTGPQLSRALVGNPFQGARFSHYLEIDVTGLDVVEGRAGVGVGGVSPGVPNSPLTAVMAGATLGDRVWAAREWRE